MIFLDIAVFAAIYLMLYKRWRAKGFRTFLVYNLMFVYVFVLLAFTLMPVLGNLPNAFRVQYKPMSLVPFRDVINNYAGSVKQIVLNVLLTVPLGFLYPIARGEKAGFLRTLIITLSVSLAIELLQPFFGRTSDITDIITNCIGGVLGFLIYSASRRVHKRIIK